MAFRFSRRKMLALSAGCAGTVLAAGAGLYLFRPAGSQSAHAASCFRESLSV
ncbi:hypothetical protein [Thermosporothrix hazakensis]|uniref:hypothetical protein n=1 Tax=Thermosporothrix hazakensis TaxID=644383 RepID=UPI003530B237